MKKKTGVIVIALSIIITVLMCYTAIAGWGAGGTGAMRNIHTGLDLSGGVSITYEANEAAPSASDMNDTIYKLQKRVEEYSTEANVYQEGANRISVEIPGVTDADAILAELGTPGSLYFIAQTDESGNTSYSYDSTVGEYVLNYTIEELTENGAIVCTGSDVASAEGAVSTQEATGNKYVVQLTFNESATAAFAAATEKAVKNNETIGIYYDGHFVSVPTVNSVISNGQAVIEGMESIEKAKELEIKNLFFVNADAKNLLEYFEENEVDRIYLNFSDPWTRKKKPKRRLTYRDFLKVYETVMKPGGEVRFKTDNTLLFEFSVGEFTECGFTLSEVTRDLHNSEWNEGNVRTEFEQKFADEGIPIKRLVATSNKK